MKDLPYVWRLPRPRLTFRDILGMVRHQFDPTPPYGALYHWFPMATPIEENEPGWFVLKWEPVKFGTYGLYWTSYGGGWAKKRIDYRIMECPAHNGWGRSYECKAIEIRFFKRTLNFWIRWNITVMEEGPGDWADRLPLDKSKIHALRARSAVSLVSRPTH